MGGEGSSRPARLFVALELPSPVREALIAWRAREAAEIEALRPVAADALHVTLCFLGARDEAEIPAIAAATTACAAPVEELALGAALWLPPRAPRVLTLALEDPRGTHVALQSRLSAALAAGGWYVPDPRPYLPHVTVARVRGAGGPRGAQRGAQRSRAGGLPPAVELAPPPPLRFGGEALVLHRSRLGPGGPRYEALARAELSG
jgi:2'-5' RNA ligase